MIHASCSQSKNCVVGVNKRWRIDCNMYGNPNSWRKMGPKS